MDIKSFFFKNKAGFVVFNCILALIVGFILLLFILHWLRTYTEHGQEVVVPQVTELYIEEAKPLLEVEKLQLVVIDSTYSRKVPLGTIVEQTPRAGSHAKHDRAVYVIVNARQRRMVPLPDLTDVSFRQAKATLRQLELYADSVEYEPSEYKDLVLSVRRGNENLEPGTRLEEGTHLILVVGYGKGTEQVEIPNLRGKTISEARSLLLGQYLTLGHYEFDEEPTDETRDLFVVYAQNPDAGEMRLQGTQVNIRLSTDLEKAATANSQQSDEDFF